MTRKQFARRSRWGGALVLVFATAAAAQGPDPLRSDTLWATVHGHRMALLVSGGGAGPTVILEPGGSSHRVWGDLPAEIARFARVVAYDRAGYGLSEMCTRPRSAAVIAEELRQALGALNLKPPFLLVGWSLGGSFVRVFAGMYPEDVAGLVLIDPAPEDFYDRAARERPAVWRPMLEEQNKRVASSSDGNRAEWAAWNATMDEARASDRTLEAPVVLLTATKSEDEFQPMWIDEHRKWGRRMSNVKHIIVEDAGHAIYRDQPRAVLDAIRGLLLQARR